MERAACNLGGTLLSNSQIQLALSLLEDPVTGASINHIGIEVFAIATGRVALRERLLVDHALGGGSSDAAAIRKGRS